MPSDDSDQIIYQLMWGYQSIFQISVEGPLRIALREVGFTGRADVLLVGFQAAGQHEYPICIEPEDGPYEPSIFANVADRSRELYEQHPDHDGFHTDPGAHEAFHARLQRQMRAKAVEEALASSVSDADRIFFAGMPMRVEDYDVHVVISVDRESLTRVPQLQTTTRERFTIYPSLVHAVIHNVLNRASRGLIIPNPGSDANALGADSPEIVQGAATSFVRSVIACAGYWFADRAGAIFSAISALPYEGRSGSGRLVIARRNQPAIDVLMKLGDEVDIRNTRAVRKLIEASGNEADLLSTGEKVLGFGKLTADYDAATETAFVVTVATRGTWELSHADQVLMTVQDGTPRLPRPPLNADYFADLVERLLPGADQSRLTVLAEAAGQHQHGAMLVVSSAAAEEAQRLAPQAWTVEPVIFESELLRQITSMDGGVLVDIQGYCHAIGVILDGQACGGEDPSRGSRFNNAVRYLKSNAPPAIVVVYSADGSIDILPRIRRRVKRSAVQRAVEHYLSLATPGKRQSGRVDAWDRVKDLQFYLSEEQCRLLNESRAALNRWNEEHDRFVLIEQDLAPDPEMNETYWLSEEQ
jgi:hypothetical protein